MMGISRHSGGKPAKGPASAFCQSGICRQQPRNLHVFSHSNGREKSVNLQGFLWIFVSLTFVGLGKAIERVTLWLNKP
jgi:hypothetical protein